MYTRSFYPEQREKISVPPNYDGTALANDSTEDTDTYKEKDAEKADGNANNESESTASMFDDKNIASGGFLSGFFSKLPIKNLTGLFKGDTQGIKIGTEELIIIGIALFLLFSKGGDKECAIMLLLLLLF